MRGSEPATVRKRPGRLDLTSVKPAQPVEPFQRLNEHFEQIKSLMKAAPRSEFSEVYPLPDYGQMHSVALLGEQHHGFRVTKPPEKMDGAGFIHANAGRNGRFDGDKFHVSVANDQLESGFAALASLLFSPDSPVREWKMTDLNAGRPDTPEGRRVTQGAQFTLYVRTGADGHYSAGQLKRIKDFVSEMERTLAAQGIGMGERPASDVAPEHWNYVSYRNEQRSGRDGTEEQALALQREPFFRLVSDCPQ
ncbi:type III effector phosphothreonine lyase [Paraburkholderia humisilvae]|uniref:type III effector phosphothreonine lyase n=1 Tax=Paraburkholderia humisilvae TaxID=627669 RepID=UPI00360D68DD